MEVHPGGGPPRGDARAHGPEPRYSSFFGKAAHAAAEPEIGVNALAGHDPLLQRHRRAPAAYQAGRAYSWRNH